MAKAEQEAFEGFEQESIRTIENQADKVNHINETVKVSIADEAPAA